MCVCLNSDIYIYIYACVSVLVILTYISECRIQTKRNLQAVTFRLVKLYIYINRFIGQVVECSPIGTEDLGSIPCRVIPMTLKMVLDNFLFNTQQYKVRIKGKEEQSWERSSALSYTLV